MEFSLITILPFIAFGFIAQAVDGALGMAYGVTGNSLLLSLGLPPAAASASIHTAEIVVTGVSGISHWRFGNINWQLVRRLIIPGIIGGALGAFILISAPVAIIKPIVAFYLLLMGIRIILKGLQKSTVGQKIFGRLKTVFLGAVGGIFDAIGGGGWGPIVTTTLVANGQNPRTTIGSVNFTEFFVTVAEVATFFSIMGLLQNWMPIVGLLIGGIIAAPFAAWLCKRMPTRGLMIAVGILIAFLSIRTILLSFSLPFFF